MSQTDDMKFVGRGLNRCALGLLVFCLVFELYGMFMLWIQLGVHLVALFLFLCNPFFTIIEDDDQKQDLTGGLIAFPLFMFLGSITRFSVDGTLLLWIAVLAGGALFAGVLWLKARELLKDIRALVIVVAVGCALTFGALTYINHYAGSLTPEEGTVVEMREVRGSRTKGGPDRHYCTIESTHGQRIEIPVDSIKFILLHKGSRVRYYHGEGALGISYSAIEE